MGTKDLCQRFGIIWWCKSINYHHIHWAAYDLRRLSGTRGTLISQWVVHQWLLGRSGGLTRPSTSDKTWKETKSIHQKFISHPIQPARVQWCMCNRNPHSQQVIDNFSNKHINTLLVFRVRGLIRARKTPLLCYCTSQTRHSIKRTTITSLNSFYFQPRLVTIKNIFACLYVHVYLDAPAFHSWNTHGKNMQIDDAMMTS